MGLEIEDHEECPGIDSAREMIEELGWNDMTFQFFSMATQRVISR